MVYQSMSQIYGKIYGEFGIKSLIIYIIEMLVCIFLLNDFIKLKKSLNESL